MIHQEVYFFRGLTLFPESMGNVSEYWRQEARKDSGVILSSSRGDAVIEAKLCVPLFTPPEYCVKASRMTQYLRRLSLLVVCSF